MGNPCKTCQSEQVGAINRALVAGTSPAEVAASFGLTKSSVSRHAEVHLPAKLAKARDAKEVADADDLLAQVRDLQGRTLAVLAQAEEKGQLVPAIMAINSARGNLELLGRLVGKLQEGAVINILINPMWLEVRAVLLEALQPYPEARTAVAAALLEVESADA